MLATSPDPARRTVRARLRSSRRDRRLSSFSCSCRPPFLGLHRPCAGRKGRSWRRPPTAEEDLQGLLLCLSTADATVPCFNFDELKDRGLDAVPKVVRVHCVELPTLVAVILDEPLVSGIVCLVGCR